MSQPSPPLAKERALANQVPLPAGKDVSSSVQHSLWVGSFLAAQSLEFLQRNNITHVLSILEGMEIVLPTDKIVHKIVSCPDHPMANLLQVLGECLRFILPPADQPQPNTTDHHHRVVLVHCASGISRSVAVCAAFLMTHHGQTTSTALRTLAQARKFANPNIGFRQQLQLLETHQHDIDAASEAWQRLYAGDVVLKIQQQRELVSSLHALVDAVEVSVATKKAKQQQSSPSLSLTTEQNRLLQLQSQLDQSVSQSELVVVDPPSRMMRKSAIAKIERLLASLSWSDEQEAKGATNKS